MANIRFLQPNLYTGASLTASSEASALPVEASQNPDRSYVYRSANENGVQTIDIDLGAVTAVKSCAVANVKLVGSGDLELYERGDAGSPGTANLVATLPAANSDRRSAVVFFAEESHRHWQLKWTNPGADTDYAELGYCHLGSYLEPSINVSVPLPLEEIDPAVVRMSVDRQRAVSTRTRYTMGRFSWMDLPDSDRDDIRSMWGSHGVSAPFFAVLDTALAWTAWLVYMSENLSEQFNEIVNRYDVGFDWMEAT